MAVAATGGGEGRGRDGAGGVRKPSLGALERAMANDELLLHFQPKVCLLRGEVVGAEALVRWNGPERTIISPDAFLPLAESSGLLHDITMRLLDRAVDACLALRRVRPGLSISMNVAPDDLESQKISNRIATLLADGTLAADDLQIEITESAVLGQLERVRDDLDRLVSLGIKVLMDDFGTGWSSIDRLSQLPFTALKLDQGIVRRMGTSRQNLDTVRSAVSMARELRMTSVAEGIESAGAYHFLIASGCEQGQGYWMGRPMSLEDFTGFLAAGTSFAGSQIGRVHQSVLNLIHVRKSLVDAAFCARLGPGDALPSVVRPEIAPDAESSRVGLWYWGRGTLLDDRASYRAIEAPYRELHGRAHGFLAMIEDGVTDARLDAAMDAIDERVDRLVGLMHSLERELLAERLEV